jgi:hypothetical protein
MSSAECAWSINYKRSAHFVLPPTLARTPVLSAFNPPADLAHVSRFKPLAAMILGPVRRGRVFHQRPHIEAEVFVVPPVSTDLVALFAPSEWSCKDQW